MGPWAIAAPIIGGALGGLGSKSAAKAANQPRRYGETSSSTLTPYGGSQYLNPFLNDLLPGAYNYSMGALPTGPNPFSMGAASQLAGMLGGGGFDLPGIHTPQLGSAPLAGIPDEVLARLESGAGFGAGLGSTGIEKVRLSPEEIATYIDENIPQELLDIARGAFLGGGNPLLDQVNKDLSRDATEAYAMSSVPAINASFSLAGRSGSGAQAVAQAYANQQFQEGLQAQLAKNRMDNLRAEEARQMQAMGLEQRYNESSRGALTSMRNTDQQVGGQLAAASAANRTRAAIEAANIRAALSQANAAMQGKYDIAQAGFDLQGSALGLQSALQAAQLKQAGLGSLFNMGQGLYANQRQAALDPFSLTAQYGASLLPALAQFGTQRSSRSGYGPGAGLSPGNAALGGGLGGSLIGYGLGSKLGGGGGRSAFDSPGLGGILGNFAGNPNFQLNPLDPRFYG